MKSRGRAFAHVVVTLCLALAFSVADAQPLPKPSEFYFDEDASVARSVVAIAGSDEATITQLVKLMERGGRNAEQATAQLAHLSMASGRTETGKGLYARALDMAGEGATRRRALHWNYAWDLYRNGEHEAALGQWIAASSNRVVHSAWAPPTLALVLWKLGRHEEAVAWYAAAVRTWPDRWPDAAALPALLPDWSDADRATLAEVLAAWREAPPTWRP